ncbi:MAG: amidohydrolase [Thermoanaerobaculia bacterium]|nr:amidohydrolase [Thermoanaerobaculia bacterium]MBP9823845.1 amidohydrolase [Thermoanaerobaculia bacterium]
MTSRWLTACMAMLLLSLGCASTAPPAPSRTTAVEASAAVVLPWKTDRAYASTYRPGAAPSVLIRNATILTAVGDRIEKGSLLIRDGKVVAVGAVVEAPPDAVVFDAAGKWVTPGIIDAHSHLGVYPSPGVAGHPDGNEATDPVTADVQAEHSVWPQDPQFALALAGGVTSLQVLPGSANLIGGRGVTLKNVPARDVYSMKFPGAPYGLKMACGENPKRVYGEKGRAPSTRMGNVAGYRAAWIRAARYRDDWEAYASKTAAGATDLKRPERDLELDTLAGVLAGEILVQNHCYRADEMVTMMEIAKEFDYKISAFHHAVEAYKIADVLSQGGICADVWADWWGFKMEAFDGIRENAALVHAAGGCAVIHSDSPVGIQRLNQEAAKAMAAGNRIGLGIREEDAIRWLTLYPAQSIGVGLLTGSLEAGKMADVVVWSGNPFSVYSHAERVYIDGALIYDRHDEAHQPVSDFSLGTTGTNR